MLNEIAIAFALVHDSDLASELLKLYLRSAEGQVRYILYSISVDAFISCEDVLLL